MSVAVPVAKAPVWWLNIDQRRGRHSFGNVRAMSKTSLIPFMSPLTLVVRDSQDIPLQTNKGGERTQWRRRKREVDAGISGSVFKCSGPPISAMQGAERDAQFRWDERKRALVAGLVPCLLWSLPLARRAFLMGATLGRPLQLLSALRNRTTLSATWKNTRTAPAREAAICAQISAVDATLARAARKGPCTSLTTR